MCVLFVQPHSMVEPWTGRDIAQAQQMASETRMRMTHYVLAHTAQTFTGYLIINILFYKIILIIFYVVHTTGIQFRYVSIVRPSTS